MAIESLQKLSSIESALNIDKTFLSQNLTTLEQTHPANDNPFLKAILDVDSQLKYADGLVEKYIAGQNIPVHDMVIAMNKAKTEIQLLVEVRNKIFEAYQEISKLQI